MKPFIFTCIMLTSPLWPCAQPERDYQRIASLPDDTGKVRKLNELSRNLFTSEPRLAITSARNALTLSHQLNFSEGIASSLNRIGTGFYSMSEYDSAEYYFRKSIAQRISSGNEAAASGTYLNLGNVFSDKDIYDSALVYYHKSLKMAELQNDVSLQIDCLLMIGWMEHQQGNHEAFERFTFESLVLAEESDNDYAQANAYQNLSIAAYNKPDYHKSIEYLTKAINYFEKAGDIQGMAACESNLAISMRQLKNWDSALQHADKAIRLFGEIDNEDGIAKTLAIRAEIKKESGHFQDAVNDIQKAIAIADSIGALRTQMLCYRSLRFWNEERGDYANAYQYYQRQTLLADSIYRLEKSRVIEELQTKYRTAEKEKQLAQKQQLIEAKNAENRLLLVGSLLIIVLSVVVLMYLRQRNVVAQKNIQLKTKQVEELLSDQEIKTYNALIDGQEKERKRIAIELHDRLGSLLTTAKLSVMSATQSEHGKPQPTELIDEAVQEVRRIARNLSSGTIHEFGLVSALRELCFNINASRHFDCRFITNCDNDRFDSNIEIELYRMAQELLTNAVKHSGATTVTVQLNQTEDSLLLIAEDDGIGFDLAKNNHGMGLSNLKLRAEKIGASVSLESAPGQGSVMYIEIQLALLV